MLMIDAWVFILFRFFFLMSHSSCLFGSRRLVVEGTFQSSQLFAQLDVLGDELLQVDVAVVDAPMLIDNDDHQRENNHDDGYSQRYC